MIHVKAQNTDDLLKNQSKAKTDPFILAEFTVIDDDNTRVKWSLYNEDDNEYTD